MRYGQSQFAFVQKVFFDNIAFTLAIQAENWEGTKTVRARLGLDTFVKIFKYSKFPQIEQGVSSVTLKDYFKNSVLQLLDTAEVCEIAKTDPQHTNRDSMQDSNLITNRTNLMTDHASESQSPRKDKPVGGYEIRLYYKVHSTYSRLKT